MILEAIRAGLDVHSGLHTFLGIVFAFLLNLNRVAVLLGVYANLPWVIAPYYAFVTMAIGAPVTRYKIPPGFKCLWANSKNSTEIRPELWSRQK